LALLAGVVWVARFWHSGHFGLYEDDFTLVPSAILMTPSQLWAWVGGYIISLGGHGRPLSDSFFSLFAHAGWTLDGLQGMYLIGFGFVALNVILFYLLLRRLTSHGFALVGALAYALYSADTTQAYLNHSLGLQQSITFLLLGVHAYLSRWRVVFYVLAVGSLLCYETVYPVAFAVPLLVEPWDRSLPRRLLRNTLVLGILLLGMLGLRTVLGEGRVEGLTWPGVITTPVVHMVEGPLVSLGTYAYRLLQALRGATLESSIAMLAALGGFTWVLSRLDLSRLGLPVLPFPAGGFRQWVAGLRSGGPRALFTGEPGRLFRLCLSGLVMLVLAYPLTFTIRAYAISGRDTRVHFAAVLGASLVVATFCWGILRLADSYGKRAVANVGLATFFALLLGFGFVIQKDYVNGWVYQRQFWTALVPLIPDAGQGSAILVDPTGLRDTRQIGANYWNMPRVLDQIYEYPSTWDSPPRVYRLAEGWQGHLASGDGQFVLDGSTTVAPPSTYGTVAPAHVIMINTAGGVLTRQAGTLSLPGGQFPLKPGGGAAEAFPKGFLYGLLIEAPGSQP
jgi:hypothetical protein